VLLTQDIAPHTDAAAFQLATQSAGSGPSSNSVSSSTSSARAPTSNSSMPAQMVRVTWQQGCALVASTSARRFVQAIPRSRALREQYAIISACATEQFLSARHD